MARIPSVRPGYNHHILQTNILFARLTLKAALRRLGHPNLASLDKDPSVLDRWADWMDSSPPRCFLSWSDPKEGSAVVEVDAVSGELKSFIAGGEALALPDPLPPQIDQSTH